MSQTIEREQRRSALDEFAAKASTSAGQLVPAAVYQSPVEQQHGAIAVAVRRDEAMIFTKIKALAAAAGNDWYYRWPVKNKKENRIDWVEGPSIKCANDLARIYGNNDVDVRIQDFGDNWLFHARFVDLENGSSLTRPFQQRKSGGTMGDDPDRRRDIAFQIGASKAIRNVVVNALQTYADFAVEEAKQSLIEKIGSDLARWRQRTTEKIAERNVDIVRVEAVIGRVAKDWLAPDVARVIAMMKAVSDGMASVDETFPPLRQAQEDTAKADLDAFAAGAAPAETMVEGDASGIPPASGDVASGEAGSASLADGSSVKSPPAAAAAPDPQSARTDAIERLLKLVSDKATSDQEKLESLESLQPAYDHLPAEFSTVLFATIAKVVRKELTAAAAKKFLEQLKG